MEDGRRDAGGDTWDNRRTTTIFFPNANRRRPLEHPQKIVIESDRRGRGVRKRSRQRTRKRQQERGREEIWKGDGGCGPDNSMKKNRNRRAAGACPEGCFTEGARSAAGATQEGPRFFFRKKTPENRRTTGATQEEGRGGRDGRRQEHRRSNAGVLARAMPGACSRARPGAPLGATTLLTQEGRRSTSGGT